MQFVTRALLSPHQTLALEEQSALFPLNFMYVEFIFTSECIVIKVA